MFGLGAKIMEKTLPSQHEVNMFLDVLRSTGKTNMFGAVPYLVKHFKIHRYDAKDFLAEWMKTFSERRERGEVIE